MKTAKPKNARAFVDAAYTGDAKAVQAMLDAGMPVDARDRGTTALQQKVIEFLESAGARNNQNRSTR
jgi:hypothetical protein